MADTYSDLTNLLAAEAPTGDKNAQAMADIDPVGAAVFNWGGSSLNAAIDERVQKLSQLGAQLSLEQRQRLMDNIAANTADWDKLTTEILGADGNKLKDTQAGWQAEEAQNIEDLKKVFGGYKSQEDLFKDPSFMAYLGGAKNEAMADPATVQAQREMLAQMRAQSSPQETAAERFQRMMAQRTAEANMRGQREAIASNLKARGAYGSGAEVAMNMMSQADEANRRYMANLAADAQAQQRAAQMLKMGSEQAAQMRNAELQQGQFANQVNMFNNAQRQATANQRSQSLQTGRQSDNAERNKMGTTLYEAGGKALANKRGDWGTNFDVMSGLTKGGIGIRQAGDTALNASDEALRDQIGTQQAGLIAKKRTGLFGGGGIG